MENKVPTLVTKPVEKVVNPNLCYVPYVGATRLFIRFPSGEDIHLVETDRPEAVRDKLIRWLQENIDWVREHWKQSHPTLAELAESKIVAERDKLREFVKVLSAGGVSTFAIDRKMCTANEFNGNWASVRFYKVMAQRLLEQLE